MGEGFVALMFLLVSLPIFLGTLVPTIPENVFGLVNHCSWFCFFFSRRVCLGWGTYSLKAEQFHKLYHRKQMWSSCLAGDQWHRHWIFDLNHLLCPQERRGASHQCLPVHYSQQDKVSRGDHSLEMFGSRIMLVPLVLGWFKVVCSEFHLATSCELICNLCHILKKQQRKRSGSNN